MHLKVSFRTEQDSVPVYVGDTFSKRSVSELLPQHQTRQQQPSPAPLPLLHLPSLSLHYPRPHTCVRRRLAVKPARQAVLQNILVSEHLSSFQTSQRNISLLSSFLSSFPVHRHIASRSPVSTHQGEDPSPPPPPRTQGPSKMKFGKLLSRSSEDLPEVVCGMWTSCLLLALPADTPGATFFLAAEPSVPTIQGP